MPSVLCGLHVQWPQVYVSAGAAQACLTSAPPSPPACAAVRDKYRNHAWFCVGNTTPFDRLPSVLLNGTEAAEARPKGGLVGAAAAGAAAAAAAAAARGRP